jgi:tRNA ligase
VRLHVKEKIKKRESPTSKPRTTSKSSEATTSIRSFSADATITSAAATARSENSDLVASLHALRTKPKKLVRSSTYPAPAEPSILVRSWKMNEFKYYDFPSPFPTLARGLFTREIRDDSQKEGEAASKTYEIVARGYDKFST